MGGCCPLILSDTPLGPAFTSIPASSQCCKLPLPTHSIWGTPFPCPPTPPRPLSPADPLIVGSAFLLLQTLSPPIASSPSSLMCCGQLLPRLSGAPPPPPPTPPSCPCPCLPHHQPCAPAAAMPHFRCPSPPMEPFTPSAPSSLRRSILCLHLMPTVMLPLFQVNEARGGHGMGSFSCLTL